MPTTPDDGPTPQRLLKSGGLFHDVGRGEGRRVTMRDDALGRAWMRRKISDAEYYALKRYALHWLAGGLQGHLGSVDLNRILAHDPGAMTGLAKTERQQDHRNAYRLARAEIGMLDDRRALVADQVACFDTPLMHVGLMLGYHSEARAREAATAILCDAADRLEQFWRDRDRE